jgi:hypothetical protein
MVGPLLSVRLSVRISVGDLLQRCGLLPLTMGAGVHPPSPHLAIPIPILDGQFDGQALPVVVGVLAGKLISFPGSGVVTALSVTGLSVTGLSVTGLYLLQAVTLGTPARPGRDGPSWQPAGRSGTAGSTTDHATDGCQR